MGTIILRFISKSARQSLWLLLLFFCISGLQAQSGPVSMQLDANIIESACADKGHVISVKVKGGQAPYTYRWQDGVEGSFRKDLPSGTYTCTVRDANGAQLSEQFNFNSKAAALELSYTQEKVGDGNNIALEVRGGKAPYQYFWFGPGVDMESTRNASSLSGLADGTFLIVVKDSNECSANITVNVK